MARKGGVPANRVLNCSRFSSSCSTCRNAARERTRHNYIERYGNGFDAKAGREGSCEKMSGWAATSAPITAVSPSA
jgi:hypothetical protein